MPDVEQPNGQPVPPTTQPAAPQVETPASADTGLSASERAELDTLRVFKNSAMNDYQALAPVRDDVVRLINDEKFRDFYRMAQESFDSAESKRTKEVPAELKPLYDNISSIKERIEKREQEDAAARQVQLNDYARRQWETIGRLGETNRWLTDNPKMQQMPPGVADVVAWATANGLGTADFQTAFDAYTGEMRRRFAPVEEPKTAPRSLRADAGTAGVPGQRGPGPITSNADIRARIAAGLRQRAG